VPLTILVAFCAGRTALRTTADDPAQIEIAQLWVDPHDLEARDLFHGSGGPALAPNSSMPYELMAIDDSGYSPGYDVRDQQGTQWSVKLGIEAQPEIVASRVLWAVGYHQPPTYLLTNWELVGKQAGTQALARFRVWTCKLMARISDQQWRDAFRAAGYQDAEQRRYITKLKSKIQEGVALAGS
jgi:hypothetical protein